MSLFIDPDDEAAKTGGEPLPQQELFYQGELPRPPAPPVQKASRVLQSSAGRRAPNCRIHLVATCNQNRRRLYLVCDLESGMCNYEERYINFREVFDGFYAAERDRYYIADDGVIPMSEMSDARIALFAVTRMKTDLAYIRKADFELSVLEGELLLGSDANVPSLPPDTAYFKAEYRTGYDYPLDILLPELRSICKKVRWDKDELDMDWDRDAIITEDDGSIHFFVTSSFGPVAEYKPVENDDAFKLKKWLKGAEYFEMYVQYLPESGRCRFRCPAFPDLVRPDFHYVQLRRELGKLYKKPEWQRRFSQDPFRDLLRLVADLSNRMSRAKKYDPNPAVWVEKNSDTRSILETELQQVLYDIEGEVRPERLVPRPERNLTRAELISREIVDLREFFRP